MANPGTLLGKALHAALRECVSSLVTNKNGQMGILQGVQVKKNTHVLFNIFYTEHQVYKMRHHSIANKTAQKGHYAINQP